MLQKWFRKLLSKEHMLHGIVLLGILGMGCILLSSFWETDEEGNSPETETLSETPEEYRMRMQAELSDILSDMAGVGRAEVLITVDGSEEYHYAKEGDSLITDEQVKNSSTYVTIGGSAGEALVESVTHPPITGVVVACEGGDRSIVQESVYHAVSVACGISTSKIYVTKLDSAT